MRTPDCPASSGATVVAPSVSATSILPTAGVALKAPPDPLAGLKPMPTTAGRRSTLASIFLTFPNSASSALSLATIDAIPAFAA